VNTDFLVFDEIHKIKGWKAFLKGIFDTRPDNQDILVTGSARMETFRHLSDPAVSSNGWPIWRPDRHG
jgi:predicted AAA+ superfamily ATPase